MKNLLYLFCVILFFQMARPLNAQEIPEMNFEELSPFLDKNNDTTYVVNFWATWCKPCVEEMPHFLEAATEFKEKKVKFLFVSLDFPGQKETRLIPFIKKNEIREQVILLNDPNSNEWINKVDASWSGAIPATLVYRNNSRTFHESSLTKEELITIIKSM